MMKSQSVAVAVIALLLVAASLAHAWDPSVENWDGGAEQLSKASEHFRVAGDALRKFLESQINAEQLVQASRERDAERDQSQQNANNALASLDEAKQIATDAASKLGAANNRVAELRAAYDAAVAKLQRDEKAANEVFEKLRASIAALIKEASAAGGAAPETLTLLQTLSKLDSKVLPQALAQVDASQLADANRWNDLGLILDEVRTAQAAVAADISAVAAANHALNGALREQQDAQIANDSAIAARDQAQRTYDDLKAIYEQALGVAAEARAEANAALQHRNEMWNQYLNARQVALDSFAVSSATAQVIASNVPGGTTTAAVPTSNANGTEINNNNNTAATGGAPQQQQQTLSLVEVGKKNRTTSYSAVQNKQRRSAAFLEKLSAVLNNQEQQ